MSEDDIIVKLLREDAEKTNYTLMHWRDFFPVNEDYDKRACCWCCTATRYIEGLYKTKDDKKYIIQRFGFQIYEDNRDLEERVYYSHDKFKLGQHPYNEYKQVIKGSRKNEYYIFLKDNKYL